MTFTKKLLGMTLAASPDLAAGLIIAHLWQHVLLDQMEWWYRLALYIAGVGCALLPDVSLIIYGFVMRKPLNSHHRNLTHYPQWILPPLFLLGFWTHWAWFAGLCLLAHFVDDFTDPGGLALLAPFSWKRFQILAKERQPLALEDWLESYFFRWNYKIGIVIGSNLSCFLVIAFL